MNEQISLAKLSNLPRWAQTVMRNLEAQASHANEYEKLLWEWLNEGESDSLRARTKKILPDKPTL